MNEYSSTSMSESIETGSSISVEELASQAMSLVLTDRGEVRAENYLNAVHRLALAYIDDDPDMRRAAIADVMASGVSSEEFMYLHAADTARYLGDLWAQNSISFVDVTIGTARIQETVRSISARRNQGEASRNAPRILLAVPSCEDHMLGAFLAAQGFRDLGCRVNLAIGRSDREIAADAALHSYNMIGISISSARTVRAACDLIKSIRSALRINVPIVVGGSHANLQDLLSETGADHAISDFREALAFCNISVGESLPT